MCFQRINFHQFSTNQNAENGLKLNNRVCYCVNLFWFINHRFMWHKLCVIIVTHYFRNRKWKKLTNWGHSMPSFTRLSLSTSPNRIGWKTETIFPKIQDCFYVHDQMWDFGLFPYGTRGLLKCPKMTVAEIGRLHEYAYRCQNGPFRFPPWNEAFWHRYAYSCRRSISFTAISGHFGNPRVP